MIKNKKWIYKACESCESCENLWKFVKIIIFVKIFTDFHKFSQIFTNFHRFSQFSQIKSKYINDFIIK